MGNPPGAGRVFILGKATLSALYLPLIAARFRVSRRPGRSVHPVPGSVSAAHHGRQSTMTNTNDLNACKEP